jgi:hypothetical protein
MFWFGFAFGVQLPKTLFTVLRLHVSYLGIRLPSVKGHSPMPLPPEDSQQYCTDRLPGISLIARSPLHTIVAMGRSVVDRLE